MSFDNEEAPKKSPEIMVGEDLSTLSLEELEKRITLLKTEIVRIESEITQKQASKSAADKFFS